ncbi:hypothetical protein VPH35_125379 [Triticum aestivum]
MGRSMNNFHTAVVLSVLLLICFANRGQCRNLEQVMENGSKVHLPYGLCQARTYVDMPDCYCCLIDNTCHPSSETCIKACQSSFSRRVFRSPPI